MSKLRFFLALLLLCFSLTPFYAGSAVLFWQLSILSTEAGHLFAILALAIFIFEMLDRSPQRPAFRYSTLILSFAAILSLLRPVAELSLHWSDWNAKMERAWGAPSVSPNWSRLLTGEPTLHRTVETFHYSDDANPLHTLDLYRARGTHAPAPWVLVLPGGGWESSERDRFWELNSELANLGYSVVVMSYRTSPAIEWPAPREDVENAIAFIKKNADRLGIESERWAILGRSAGGQIGESVAYENPPTGLRSGIFIYAPSDLDFGYRNADENDLLHSPALMRRFFGGTADQKPDVYHEASPMNYVRSGSVPTLLLHGASDPIVWNRHSERLQASLAAAGVSSVWLELPWATHGFDYFTCGPGYLISTYAIERFLKKTLQL